MAPINRMSYAVMPDVISLPRQVLSRGHQEDFKDWIPAPGLISAGTSFAGMTSWQLLMLFQVVIHLPQCYSSVNFFQLGVSIQES